MSRIKSFLDKYTEKFISRKFLVFILATLGLCFSFLTKDEWMAIAIAYIGAEGFSDLAIAWKTGMPSHVAKAAQKALETKDG